MIPRARWCRPLRHHLSAGLCLLLLAGCRALQPSAVAPPAFYALDNLRAPVRTTEAAARTAPTLVVGPPRAAAGFDSQRIIYVRSAHRLEYFANSEWVEPPARMLSPLMVGAIERSGAFRAVVSTPASAAGELRLDTELVRLQHEFLTQPSRVRVTLRATLVDERTRRVLGWREFDSSVAAPSEDPYGGVVAANQAVRELLEQLAAFCAETARGANVVQ